MSQSPIECRGRCQLRLDIWQQPNADESNGACAVAPDDADCVDGCDDSAEIVVVVVDPDVFGYLHSMLASLMVLMDCCADNKPHLG